MVNEKKREIDGKNGDYMRLPNFVKKRMSSRNVLLYSWFLL